MAEHIQLLLVVSTHDFFLSPCDMETREFSGTERLIEKYTPSSAFEPSMTNPPTTEGILSCGRANVSNSDLTSILFILLLLVGLAQLLGYFFVKLRQPKVVGEILAGIVLGPALIGRLPFASRLMEATKHQVNILNFVYWLR